MVEYAERMLAGWADGQVRDVHDDMMRVTLEVVAKMLFDADITGDSADASAAMETLIRCFTARVDRIIRLPERFPTPANLRLRRAIAAARPDRLPDHRRAPRRAARTGATCSRCSSHAQDEDDERRMTDRQLRDEAMTLFMAGHETTRQYPGLDLGTSSSQNPRPRRALHAELAEVLVRPAPTFADLPRLAYAERVITEALRLYPTVWLLGREAIEPCTIGGYRVPVGHDGLDEPVGPAPRPAVLRRPRGVPPGALGRRSGEDGCRATPTSRSAAVRGSASATASP